MNKEKCNGLIYKLKGIVYVCIFLVIFISAPLYFGMVKFNILPYFDMGNKLEYVKVQENNLIDKAYNEFSYIKTKIKDIYINYLPFRTEVLNMKNNVVLAFNRITIQNDVQNEFRDDIQDDVQNDDQYDILNDIQNDIRDDVTDDVQNDVQDDARDDVQNDVQDDTLNDAQNDVRDDVTDDVQNDVQDDARDDVQNDDQNEELKEKINARVEYVSYDDTMRHYILTYIDKNGVEHKSLEGIFYYDKDELEKRKEKCLNDLNNLIEHNTEVNFYVMGFERFQESDFFADIIKAEENLADDKYDFFNRISNRAKKKIFKMNSIDERYDYYYLTDHHLNNKGVKKLYNSIHSFLAENIEGLTPPAEVIETNTFDVKWGGTVARSMSYYNLLDEFTVDMYDLPYHEPLTLVNMINLYKSGNFEKDPKFDQYEFFHIGPMQQHYHYPEVNEGRNLLILGDSYMSSVVELVASHFNNTYIRTFWHDPIDYDKFIEENNITDVLYCQILPRMMFDGYNNWDLSKKVVIN